MAAPSPTLQELVAAIDDDLTAWLEAKRGSLPHSELLIGEMERLLRAGGKRLRPAFCYWGFRATGRPHRKEALRAASALELLHTFAIVHDDIMDASDERRGEPTVHVAQGTNVALLVGDLALVLADDMLMESGFSGDVLVTGFSVYSRMREQVIVGQYLDVVAGREPVTSEDRARLIARLKSGRYSIQEPLLLGATLGGASGDLLRFLGDFGETLGEAFQLNDDLLGTFGERAATGKPTDSDIREGKRHLLFARAAASLQGPERSFFLDHWGGGDKLTDRDTERLRAFIDSSGARRYTEELLDRLVSSARAALAEMPIGDDARAALEELVHVATGRD